jgi:hypothetical protein
MASQEEEPPESTAFAITMACMDEAYEAQASAFLQEGKCSATLQGNKIWRLLGTGHLAHSPFTVHLLSSNHSHARASQPAKG